MLVESTWSSIAAFTKKIKKVDKGAGYRRITFRLDAKVNAMTTPK